MSGQSIGGEETDEHAGKFGLLSREQTHPGLEEVFEMSYPTILIFQMHKLWPKKGR